MTEVKQKKCYRKCPQCSKVADSLCAYEKSNILGYIKTKCQWCNFKEDEYISADPIMVTSPNLHPERQIKKLSTAGHIDTLTATDTMKMK